MAVVGVIVLFFQAVLLAHGGLTTLGANTFSMAVVGPWAAYAVFTIVRSASDSLWAAAFGAAVAANMATYVTTSVQLGLAYPDPHGGVVTSVVTFLGVFAITQIPVAIVEGLVRPAVIDLAEALRRRHAIGESDRPRSAEELLAMLVAAERADEES